MIKNLPKYIRIKKSKIHFIDFTILFCFSLICSCDSREESKIRITFSEKNKLASNISWQSPEPTLFELELKSSKNIINVRTKKESTKHELKIIGLYPETEYELVIKNLKDQTFFQKSSFITSSLPQDINNLKAEISTNEAQKGFFLVSQCRDTKTKKRQNKVLKIVDEKGKVVWYKTFKGNTNNYFLTKDQTLLYVSVDRSDMTKQIIEEDFYGNVVFKSKKFKILEDNNFNHWVYKSNSDTYLTIAFTSKNRSSPALKKQHVVIGSKLIEIDQTGDIVWSSSAFDFYDLERKKRFDRPSGNLHNIYKDSYAEDWTHANSIVDDSDGNLIISFRNTNQIIKLNKESKEIMWAIGDDSINDYQSDIKLSDEQKFNLQHAAFTNGNKLYIYDNGPFRSDQSRIQILELDDIVSPSKIVNHQKFWLTEYSSFQGNIDLSLSDDRLLATIPEAGKIVQLNKKGDIIWKLSSQPDQVFKVFYLRKLNNIN